jgi:hypothetical protein
MKMESNIKIIIRNILKLKIILYYNGNKSCGVKSIKKIKLITKGERGNYG